MTKSRALAWAVAAAIAAAAFEPFYLRIFTVDRAAFAAMLTELPYRKLPGARRFLVDVRSRTGDGDAIAIAADLPRATHGEDAYRYLYARAWYLLPGRRVIPLVGWDGRPQPENIAGAGYIAAYRSEPAVPGFAPVWRGRDGVLLRRTP